MKKNFEQTEHKIDWDKQQLLICERTNQIVLTTGNHDDELFCGIEIGGDEQFHEDWVKHVFRVFYGTISND